MTGINGIETCKHLKSLPLVKDVPVIFITSFYEHEDFCWDIGGVDFIKKPFTNRTVFNRVKAHLTIKLQRDRLLELVFLDSLTEVYNRRYFDTHFKKTDLNAKRNKSDYALIIIDIDLFKLYNDQYGHDIGDIVLQKVALAIDTSLLRKADIAARYGGEEFLLILDNTDKQQAFLVAERIRKTVEEYSYLFNGKIIPVTISLGAATFDQKESLENLQERADKALYKAKNQGRNIVVSSELKQSISSIDNLKTG